MRTLLEILNLTTSFLESKKISHPRRQAEDLLSMALGISRMGLYLEFDRPLTDKELTLSREWLKRRSEGEPLQYISGSLEFFGCHLMVTPHALIPRQETEILVDKIALKLSEQNLGSKVLWDVCCGSGCIGIALKKRFPSLTVVLSDISEQALSLAKENGKNNGVEVEYLQGDLLTPFLGRRCDYFVCNPPYIAEHEFEGLDKEVRLFEPRQALISGATGLEFYQRLAGELKAVLNPQAKVWFEIGKGQGEGVVQAFQAPCWVKACVENDWSGHERFFSLEIE